MEVIRFTIEGLVNSFRRIETATYQNTELTPKKTHIAGILTNIMGGVEDFYYTLLPQIKVGIIPLNLENMFVDLWQYKKWKTANRGRAVVKREKLYHAKYEVYLEIPVKLKENVFRALQEPKRPPALSMDDELVEIKNVSKIDIKKINSNGERKSVYSTFPEEWVNSYSFLVYPIKNKLIIPPRSATTNLGFNRGPPRRALEFLRIVEFFGGYCEIEPKKDGFIYSNGDKNIVMW